MSSRNLEDLRGQVEIVKYCKTKTAELKELQDKAVDEIKAAMGEAENGMLDGEPVIRWDHQKRVSLDQKALKDERPEIAAEFMVATEVRRFQVL
jgi:predicted phage-related endonuclease